MNYIMMTLGIIALFIGHLVQDDYNKVGFMVCVLDLKYQQLFL